jgi:hypothetical protein
VPGCNRFSPRDGAPRFGGPTHHLTLPTHLEPGCPEFSDRTRTVRRLSFWSGDRSPESHGPIKQGFRQAESGDPSHSSGSLSQRYGDVRLALGR